MIVTLSMPDELYNVYVKHNPQNPHKGIVKQLERFKDVPLPSATLIFSPEDMARMAELTKTCTESPSQLLDLLERALSIKVGDVNVPLTESQCGRLEQYAFFYGKTVPEYLTMRLNESLLTQLGA
jgi:hypothetical protein